MIKFNTSKLFQVWAGKWILSEDLQCAEMAKAALS